MVALSIALSGSSYFVLNLQFPLKMNGHKQCLKDLQVPRLEHWQTQLGEAKNHILRMTEVQAKYFYAIKYNFYNFLESL